MWSTNKTREVLENALLVTEICLAGRNPVHSRDLAMVLRGGTRTEAGSSLEASGGPGASSPCEKPSNPPSGGSSF